MGPATFVLWIMMHSQSGGVALRSQEYGSEAACNAALGRVQAMSQNEDPEVKIEAFCSAKGNASVR